MKPLTIVISFDVNERVMPGSFPGWIANEVHEFGFDRAKAAFHRGVVPTISLAAHRLDDGGSIEDLAVIRGAILVGRDRNDGLGQAAAFGVGWPWSGPRSSVQIPWGGG